MLGVKDHLVATSAIFKYYYYFLENYKKNIPCTRKLIVINYLKVTFIDRYEIWQFYAFINFRGSVIKLSHQFP